MVRFRCQRCGREDVKQSAVHHLTHRVRYKSLKAVECMDCDTLFPVPHCCGGQMLIAS